MKKSLNKVLQLAFLLLVLPGILFPGAAPVVPFARTAPVIDGKLEDPVWKDALSFTGFKTFKPDYGKPGSGKTIVYMTYDREHIYFAVRCFDASPDKIKASMTKRDSIYGDDWFAITLDTFNDHQSGYSFLVNPLGVQGDGILNSDGNLDDSHDMVWYSKGELTDEGYTVEIKIPFKSIRYRAGKKVNMGLWLARNVVRTSENLSYPEITADGGSPLMQMQEITLTGIKYNRIVEILPAFTYNRDHEQQAGSLVPSAKDSEFSLTGKLGLTPQLTLDATYNPDFSQVEADAGQVDVNLRYALFFPEKRPFFLEGKELFDIAGNTDEAPLQSLVHTRTIIDPRFGFKLSGKVSKHTSLSALYARDESPAQGIEDGSNADFIIMRVRYGLKNDSYIGAFYTGREFMDGFNRVTGIDGRLRFSGKSLASFHLLGSFSKDNNGGDSVNGHALAFKYNYESRSFIAETGIQDVSQDFRVDTGFLTRTGLTRLATFAMYKFYPKSKFFQRIEPFYWSYHILDKESNMVDTTNLFSFRVHMPGSTVYQLYFFLGNEVFAGQRFNRDTIATRLETQVTKQLFLVIYMRYGRSIFYDPGQPFDGKSFYSIAALEYQPLEKLNTSLDVSYSNFFRLADSEKMYDYTLVRSRTTFQVNKYLFFRGIVEYNFYRKRMLTDLLASFTYIPGTVIHLGYGSVYEKLGWDPATKQYIASDRFLELQRGLFFKVSYLWRL
jgi:hypothetical protein